jgi:AraC family transcriptional regulator, transcriptional activator FtrA
MRADGASSATCEATSRCVVASRPSSKPKLAKIRAPLHTDMTISALSLVRSIHLVSGASCMALFVPRPPGTTKIWGGGQSSSDRFGINLKPFIAVKTRSSVPTKTTSKYRPAFSSAVTANTSKGPATSSTSTSSKITIATQRRARSVGEVVFLMALEGSNASDCQRGAETLQVAEMPRSVNKLTIALVYDGLCTFEFACAAEVFGLPRPDLEPGWYRFETCAMTRRPVIGQFGLRIKPDAGLQRMVDASIVVVPGWRSLEAPVPARLVTALRTAHARGARLVSICSGAFVLAATGLLDGRRATTHWRLAPLLQRMYPAIDVEPNVLYVADDDVMTSAGSAAGLDLCLHLVRRDFGPQSANHVARQLVIAPHREGGQAQFVERPIQKNEDDRLTAVLEEMHRNPNGKRSISQWAARAGMSERTFIRRFKASAGTTPGKWLTVARLDRARELLESSTLSVDRIAQDSGFGDAATLRHHFRARLGTTPTAYRRRFANR